MAPPDLSHLLATYGYFAVLVAIAIESMGIPFPGETTLLLASVYAGTTHRLSLPWVIVAASAGAILGDNIGFWAGREGGYRLARRYGSRVGLDERRLKLGQYLFRKHGAKVVFFGRFVAVLRAWAAFLAGTNRMAWRPFLIYNALGGIVWSTLVTCGAYFFGDRMHHLMRRLGPWFFVLGVAASIASYLFIRRHEQRLLAEAERGG
jgi:membrane protein DedA with SNARE-associated domain